MWVLLNLGHPLTRIWALLAWNFWYFFALTLPQILECGSGNFANFSPNHTKINKIIYSTSKKSKFIHPQHNFFCDNRRIIFLSIKKYWSCFFDVVIIANNFREFLYLMKCLHYNTKISSQLPRSRAYLN